MQSSMMTRCRARLATLPAAIAILSAEGRAQAPAKFETFTATAVNLTVGTGETLRINVLTWTPAAEREKVVAALQKGPDALVEALRTAPSHGYIWTSESIGYTLRFAHKLPLANGGERIVLAVDRPLGSWSRNAWRAGAEAPKDGQVLVVELRLTRQGRGEGKMSLAAPIGVDQTAGTLALENYDAAPVLLKQVSRGAAPASP
jgi:hypothetical protein